MNCFRNQTSPVPPHSPPTLGLQSLLFHLYQHSAACVCVCQAGSMSGRRRPCQMISYVQNSTLSTISLPAGCQFPLSTSRAASTSPYVTLHTMLYFTYLILQTLLLPLVSTKTLADPFLLSISVFIFSFFISLFCLVPCGILS